MIRSELQSLRETYEWIEKAYPQMHRYECIACVLRLHIIRNRMPPGTRLPSLRRLAQCLRISLVTAAAAYRRLEQDGLTVSVQGSGHWVAVDVNHTAFAKRERRRYARKGVPQPDLFGAADPPGPTGSLQVRRGITGPSHRRRGHR